jgi:hypothetical protein
LYHWHGSLGVSRVVFFTPCTRSIFQVFDHVRAVFPDKAFASALWLETISNRRKIASIRAASVVSAQTSVVMPEISPM